MSDELRTKLHGEYRNEIVSRMQSNSENYDKEILTLSTALLGLSLTFIKDIVPLEKAIYDWLLIGSWILFMLAIISVIGSFLMGNISMSKSIEYSYKYYIEQDENYANKKSLAYYITEVLNWVSGIFFIAGFVFSIVFIGININEKIDIKKDINLTKVQDKTVVQLKEYNYHPVNRNSDKQNNFKASKNKLSSKSDKDIMLQLSICIKNKGECMSNGNNTENTTFTKGLNSTSMQIIVDDNKVNEGLNSTQMIPVPAPDTSATPPTPKRSRAASSSTLARPRSKAATPVRRSSPATWRRACSSRPSATRIPTCKCRPRARS